MGVLERVERERGGRGGREGVERDGERKKLCSFIYRACHY